MPFGSFIVTDVVCVSVLRSATSPFARLVGMMTVKRVLVPPASCFNYVRLAFGFARKDFHSVLRLFCRGGRAVPSAVARQDFPS